MAEAVAVVGLLSSIVQLITFGTAVVRRLNEYKLKTRELPETFRVIRVQLPLFLNTLRDVESQVRSGRIKQVIVESLKAVVDNSLEQTRNLVALLDKCEHTSGSGGLQRRLQALRSLSYDEKVAKILTRLQNNMQLLVFHQSTTQMNTTTEVLRELESLRTVCSGHLPDGRQRPTVQIDIGQNHPTYIVNEGLFTTSARFEAETSEKIAKLVREQIERVLPEAMHTLQSQLEPKYQAWFERQVSTVSDTLEAFCKRTEKRFADENPSGVADDFPDEFLDFNNPSKEQSLRSSTGFENQRMTLADRDDMDPPTKLPDLFFTRSSIPKEKRIRGQFPKRPFPSVKKETYYWDFGSLHIQFTKWTTKSTSSKRNISFEIRITFQPLPALLKRGITVAYLQKMGYRGQPIISPSIEAFAIVPDDSPVFKLAADGNLDGLRYLFRERLANPSDQTKTGQTPLKVSFGLIAIGQRIVWSDFLSLSLR